MPTGNKSSKKPPEPHPTPRISQAPPPVTELSGRGWIPSRPEPPVAPSELPWNYPSVLRVKTDRILTDTLKQFQDRFELIAICRAVVSAMTQVLCSAVTDGVMANHAAPDHMGEVLHRICVRNCNPRMVPDIRREARSWPEWADFLKRLDDGDMRAKQESAVHTLGKWADELLEEAVKVAEQIRSGASQADLRPQFPRFFKDVIEQMPTWKKQEFFEGAAGLKLTKLDLLAHMAFVKGMSGTTLGDKRKSFRATQRATVGKVSRSAKAPRAHRR